MNHQKQRGKSRMTPNRAPRNNKIPNSQNVASHNFKMGDDNDYKIYENPYLTHVAMSLLGCTVQVRVKNGYIYEGIFRAVSPKMEINLELAHVVEKNGQTEQVPANKPNKASVCDSLVFAAKDIASIIAKDVDLEYAYKKDSFSTDQQISRQFNNGQTNERELQPWKPHTDCNEEDSDWLGEDSPHMKNGWDVEEMFQKNADKFGVTSSFNTEMPEYTIPLEKSNDKDYIERERRAAQIAHEIETSTGFREREELDSSRTEEEKYAAVVKRNGITNTSSSSDKYIPPALRQGSTRGDLSRQTKEPVVINSVRDGSPKPQRVIPAKPADDHSSVPDSEQASIRPSSPASSGLVAKTDKLQISTSQPAAAVSTFSTVTTVCVTTVTATVAPISSSTVTVTASAYTATVANPSSSLPAQAVSPSDQTVSGERKNKETIEELKDFHSNFNYDPGKSLLKKRKEGKETPPQTQTEAEKDVTVVDTAKDTENESSVTVQEEKQSTNDSSTESILATSKLNPNAKEFKFNPNAKEFKPFAQQQRHTPPMQSGQQYAIQSQVPISPGPSYSPSFSMQQTYPPSMLVIGPQQVSQPPTGPPFRPQGAKYNVQSRPYGPRDPSGEPGMTGHRVITAAAAAGSPIIAPGTPPQQIPMMPQATPLYPGVAVPQQVISQQAPGVNYVPIIPAPNTPPHFMASHSAGMSSSGLPGTPSYTYSFSQDVASVPMYVAGNVAAVPGSPAMQGQPQPGPSQQFVFHVPSQVPSPHQVATPQGGPISGHPAPGAQIIYVSGGPQPAPPVGAVPVSSSPLQQPQYSGRRSGEGRVHGPRAQAFQPRGQVHFTYPQYMPEPRPKPGGS